MTFQEAFIRVGVILGDWFRNLSGLVRIWIAIAVVYPVDLAERRGVQSPALARFAVFAVRRLTGIVIVRAGNMDWRVDKMD